MSNLHFKKKGKKEASRYAERAGMMVATGFHDNGVFLHSTLEMGQSWAGSLGERWLDCDVL
jgi:hypothetical protein